MISLLHSLLVARPVETRAFRTTPSRESAGGSGYEVVFVLTACVLMARVLAAIGKKSNDTALLLLITVSSVSAQVTLAPLSQSEITTTLFGTRVTGEYASGLGWAERFNTDLTSNYVQDGIATQGRMRFEGSNLCFEYGDDEFSGGCFEVWRRGANCFDFYVVGDSSLPASIDQKRFGRGWDARAWIDGQPSTCTTDQIS